MMPVFNHIDKTPEYSRFITKLLQYHRRHNSELQTEPVIGGQRLDLLKLYIKVIELGGYDEVTARNAWKSLGDELFKFPESCINAEVQLKKLYEQNLCGFEQDNLQDHTDLEVDVTTNATASTVPLSSSSQSSSKNETNQALGRTEVSYSDMLKVKIFYSFPSCNSTMITTLTTTYHKTTRNPKDPFHAVPLKKILLQIMNASPELCMPNLNTDHSIYTINYPESLAISRTSVLLEGRGLVSWVVSEPGEGQSLVLGKLVIVEAKDDSGPRESSVYLEVFVQLKESPKIIQAEHRAFLDSLKESLTNRSTTIIDSQPSQPPPSSEPSTPKVQYSSSLASNIFNTNGKRSHSQDESSGRQKSQRVDPVLAARVIHQMAMLPQPKPPPQEIAVISSSHSVPAGQLNPASTTAAVNSTTTVNSSSPAVASIQSTSSSLASGSSTNKPIYRCGFVTQMGYECLNVVGQANTRCHRHNGTEQKPASSKSSSVSPPNSNASSNLISTTVFPSKPDSSPAMIFYNPSVITTTGLSSTQSYVPAPTALTIANSSTASARTTSQPVTTENLVLFTTRCPMCGKSETPAWRDGSSSIKGELCHECGIKVSGGVTLDGYNMPNGEKTAIRPITRSKDTAKVKDADSKLSMLKTNEKQGGIKEINEETSGRMDEDRDIEDRSIITVERD